MIGTLMHEQQVLWQACSYAVVSIAPYTVCRLRGALYTCSDRVDDHVSASKQPGDKVLLILRFGPHRGTVRG